MPQPDHITALTLPLPDISELPADIREYFEVCEEKLGFVPNVLLAHTFDIAKLRVFMDYYNELMLSDSGLSKLEREMIAVVVSSANHCYYCLVAHGAAVRHISRDPELGEMLVANYRAADLDERQRAILDFAWKMTVEADEITEADRQKLRDVGLSDRDIWDTASVAGFFNMSNRMAGAVDMMPNPGYHSKAR